MAARREHAIETRSFKDALHQTFYRSAKSIAELAELLGVSRQYLQAAADENEPDRHLSGRLFPALATHADNCAWLDLLETLAGRVAFVVPVGDAAQVSRVVREFGEFLEALDDAADNCAWLDLLETLAGRVAFVVPVGDAAQVSRVVREFGEFLEALDDAADIEKEGREAIAAIAAEIERRRAVQRR